MNQSHRYYTVYFIQSLCTARKRNSRLRGRQLRGAEALCSRVHVLPLFVAPFLEQSALRPQLFSWRSRCTVKCTITAVSLKPRPGTFVTAHFDPIVSVGVSQCSRTPLQPEACPLSLFLPRFELPRPVSK